MPCVCEDVDIVLQELEAFYIKLSAEVKDRFCDTHLNT